MNASWTKGLIVLGAALVLGALNFAIVGKERIRREGEVVYLELVPVDPRSMLQGDYMALRFAVAQELQRGIERSPPSNGETGFAEVALDAGRVARLATPGTAPGLRLRYRIRGGQVWLGTNAFFFEEGRAERFNGARYGEFRVDRSSGEAVLVGLRNAALQSL